MSMTDCEIRARLTDRLAQVEQRIAAACRRAGRSRAEVTLVAVTKTVGPRVVRLLPELGMHDVGENRPQELKRKYLLAPHLRWHMIGHLQRNKIDLVLPTAQVIHSLDSVRLLTAVDQALSAAAATSAGAGTEAGALLRGLIQFNLSGEASKFGFAVTEIDTVANTLRCLKSLPISGLMTMAAYTDDPETTRPTFRALRLLRDRLAEQLGRPASELGWLSMGMSNDFEIAIEEGATHLRLGTVLFEDLPTD